MIRKNNIFLLLWILLFFAVDSPAQKNQTPVQPGFFPFSVWYSGGKARAPMLSQLTPQSEAEWRLDLKQIKALGFNTVRTWVEWAACEPQRGKYNFDNLRLLLKLADEVGLRVFIQIYVDSAPDWVAQQFPDALFEAQSGDKVYPQAAPGACTDNQDVEEAVLDFYTETAKVTTTYDSFFGYDLWSEPHIINWASLDYIPNVQFCFCPGTRSRFRQWLKEKYTTLEKLNNAWYRHFSDWSQVDPPRFSTILSYTDFIDWKTFIYEKLADDMKSRYDAVRKADRAHLITAHCVGASLVQSPHTGAGATDDFLMAKPLDFYGISMYPKHNQPDRAWSLTTLRTYTDFARSVNREKGGWYVGELQAGTGTVALLVSDPVTADDQRIWIWSAISKGARAINIYAYYPMSSGYESGGYGLINLDGTLTDRAVKAGELAKVVDRNQELFLSSTPVKAQIGIVYNPLTQMVGGMQRRDYPSAMTNSLIGYYQTFANHNVPVDFIHRQHLEKQDLSQYKLLIVPYPVMFTEKAASGLREFVRKGGYVLAEARLAWNDDRGYASGIIPGLGLHEVFGVRENEIRMRENASLTLTDLSHPALTGFKMGETLKGSLYTESLKPLGSGSVEILAATEMGQPVIVSTHYGNGEAMLAGSYLGMANFPDVEPNNDKFFINLLHWAKIERPFTTSLDGRISNQVEVRLQENNNGYLVFVINFSDTSEAIDISLKISKEGDYRIRDVLEETVEKQKSEGNVLKLHTRLESKKVRVWEIEKD
jgi:beta-galactosidase